MQLPLVGSEFVDEAGDLHIVAAILGDLMELAFIEPADGLQSLGGFFHAKRGGGDGIQ
jgi:hypothetical protein